MAFKNLMAKPMAVLSFSIAIILGFAILSAVLPSLKGYSSNLTQNLTSGGWGSALADSISGIFGLFVGVLVLAAIVGLIVGFASIGGNKNSGL